METLQSLRNAQELTQKQLADRLRVSIMTVWRWEQGKSKPHLVFHEPYAEALGVSPEVLWGIIYGEAAKQI